MSRLRRMGVTMLAFLVYMGIGQAEAGNITLEVPTGQFINPTAEMLPPKTFTVQGCWLNQDLAAGDLNGYAIFASYTFPTMTEVGISLHYVDPPLGGTKSAPGAFIRQLLLAEGEMRPALAIGATIRESDDISRRSVFLSASKTVTPKEAAYPVHVHLGGKWVRNNSDDDATVYGGVDVDLTKDLKLGAEVTAKTKFDTKVPFAVGIQYRFMNRLGVTLAAVNAGGAKNPGVYFGIGFPFTGY